MFSNLSYIWRNLGAVTKNLIIINILVFAVMSLVGDFTYARLMKYGALHYLKSPDFLPSQLFTYMFMHANLSHLFFNMFALFMFGGIIERSMGSARFLFYYISCGLGAALIQEGVFAIVINHIEGMLNVDQINHVILNGAGIISESMNYQDPLLAKLNLLINIPTIGASGAIYGVLLAFGYIFPRRPIYLMFIPVPIQARWMVLGYGVIELLQTLSSNPADNTAHLAHLGGMIIGLLILIWWRRKGLIERFPY